MKKLNFAWPSSTPSGGVLNLYVWQPYRQRAVFDIVTITWTQDSPDQLRQALLLFDVAEDLQLCVSQSLNIFS